ncbi:MAG TPA: hypothetical protein VHB21_08720 [Minicystis sp.]|nr:hypothetical protein [Minicystis sp.]
MRARHPARRPAAVLACSLALAPACAALVVAWPSRAWAQPHDAYKQHMENGYKLFQDKNYPAALIEFRAAYEAKPKANPLLNMALCYKAEFNYPKAIQTLEKALKEHADTMDPGDKRAAEDAIKEMRGLLAYVNVHVKPEQVAPQVVLTVDGEDLAPGAATQPVPLGPGTHKIGGHSEGYQSQQDAEITVASGEKGKTVTLTLAPNRGWLRVDFPGMLIGIDGKNVGRDRYAGFVTPGPHVVQIYAPGKPGYPVSIEALVGQQIYIQAGPRGVPVVRASVPSVPVAMQATPVVGPTPQPAAKKEPEPPPEPPKPPVKGFYLTAGSSIVWPVSHAAGADYTTNSGWSVQGVGGYRVNNAAAFQVLFEYMNVFTPLSTAELGATPNDGYTESTFRFGAGVRLMTPGKTVRLVGGVNGGLAIDSLDFTNKNLGTHTGGNANVFLLGEIGLELDLSGVLLGVCGQGVFQSTRGFGAPTASSNPLAVLGLGLRVGYAFWK